MPRALKIWKELLRSVKEGVDLLTCEERIEGRGGYFYRPTILSSVTPSMEVAQEKVFGPLATVIVADYEKGGDKDCK